MKIELTTEFTFQGDVHISAKCESEIVSVTINGDKYERSDDSRWYGYELDDANKEIERLKRLIRGFRSNIQRMDGLHESMYRLAKDALGEED